MHLSYGELEEFIAHLHRVAPEKRTALKGRLKHFQRLSWPAGTNKGKGARVNYGVGQTFSLAVAFEMLQIGLTPERVVEQLRMSTGLIARGFAAAYEDYGPHADPIYYIFSPQSLYALRGLENHPEGHVSLLISQSELGNSIAKQAMFRFRRLAMVNLTEIFDEYVSYFIDKGLAAPDNLQEPLDNWQSVERDLMRRVAVHYAEGDSGDT